MLQRFVVCCATVMVAMGGPWAVPLHGQTSGGEGGQVVVLISPEPMCPLSGPQIGTWRERTPGRHGGQGKEGLTAQAAVGEPPALNGFDPVWLVRGGIKAGTRVHAVTHGYYSYYFVSAETRAEFLREPERYAIQMDGACARMGAASGVGSQDRWVVHAGRIYIFDSDPCRARFLRQPDAVLDPPAAAREVSAEQAAEARRWWERARQAHGITRAVFRYSERSSLAVGAGRVVRTYRWEAMGEAPDRVTEEFDYPEFGVYGDTVTAEEGTYFVNGKREAHRPAQHKARGHELWLHPMALLLGEGAVMWPEGEPEGVREIGVERFGAVAYLGIDAKTGHVRHVRYRGRGPEMTLGEIVDFYYNDRGVSGVTVPFHRESKFNGEIWLERSRMLEGVEIEVAR